jgi:hypothetical protein
LGIGIGAAVSEKLDCGEPRAIFEGASFRFNGSTVERL